MSDTSPQETFFTRSRRSSVFESGHKAKLPFSKRTILISIGILILLGMVIFSIFASNNEDATENESPLPTQSALPTEEATPTIEEATPTEEITPSPTLKTSVTPTKSTSSSSVDKATGLDRADLTIEIQNGSGVAGAATKASTTLKDLGYDVLSTGNADNFDYESTVIKVKSSKKNFLELLKKDLSDDYTIDETSSSLTGSEADAVVVVGKT